VQEVAVVVLLVVLVVLRELVVVVLERQAVLVLPVAQIQAAVAVGAVTLRATAAQAVPA